MTKINDLNTKDELQPNDKFIVWDGSTRAITAAKAAHFFEPAGVSELSGAPIISLPDKVKVRKSVQRDWLARGNGSDDDTSRINEFLAAAVSAGVRRVYIDEGDYVISNSGLPGHIGYGERCSILLSGAQNLEIVSEGAVFTFVGTNRNNYAHLIYQKDCKNTGLFGLSLAYRFPPFAWGRVSAKGSNYFDVTLEVPYPTWSDVQRIELYDPVRRLNNGIIWQKTSNYATAGQSCTQQSSAIIRIDMTGLASELAALNVNDYVNLTHQIYGSNALQYDRCTDIFVRDVSVSHTAGMLARMDDCDFAFFQRLQCGAATNQLIACTADGVHAAGLRRQFFMDQCRIADICDDGTNVHSYFYSIQSIPSASSISFFAPSTVPGSGQPPPRVGDTISLLNPNGLLDTYSGKVVSITKGPIWTIQLSAALPGGISTSWFFTPADTIPETFITNSIFERIRGSAMLVQSRQAIIQNNFAQDVTNAMLSFWQFKTYFSDSINPKDNFITGNSALNCLRWDVNPAVIMGFAENIQTPGTYAATGGLENIYVTNNLIQGGANAGIWLTSVLSGSVCDNDIQDLRHEDTSTWSGAGAFEIALENCNKITVSGNRSIGSVGLMQTLNCTNTEEGLNPGFTRLTSFSLGAGQTSQIPPSALTIVETGHATSKRAALSIADILLLQDTGASGVKDFGIYNNSTGQLVLRLTPTGGIQTYGLPTSNPGGTGLIWNDSGTLKVT